MDDQLGADEAGEHGGEHKPVVDRTSGACLLDEHPCPVPLLTLAFTTLVEDPLLRASSPLSYTSRFRCITQTLEYDEVHLMR